MVEMLPIKLCSKIIYFLSINLCFLPSKNDLHSAPCWIFKFNIDVWVWEIEAHIESVEKWRKDREWDWWAKESAMWRRCGTKVSTNKKFHIPHNTHFNMKCVLWDDGVAKEKHIELLRIKNQFNDANRTQSTDINWFGFSFVCVHVKRVKMVKMS